MVDIVSKAIRSKMMSGIRSKNTKPEMVLRKALHARGFRFRIHVANLPGKPDIVLPKYQATIDVHGCFWHGHNCAIFKYPKTNPDFWHEKIAGNKQRDLKNNILLSTLGWRSLTVWECTTRRREEDNLVDVIADWLQTAKPSGEIGTNADGIIFIRAKRGIS